MKNGVSCHPFFYSEGHFHRLSFFGEVIFVGNHCGNVYPYFSLFALFSSAYSTYIEWIHVIQILNICKVQHQVKVALCNLLV